MVILGKNAMKKILFLMVFLSPLFTTGCTNPQGFFEVLLDPETGMLAPKEGTTNRPRNANSSPMKPDTEVQREAQAYARILFR